MPLTFLFYQCIALEVFCDGEHYLVSAWVRDMAGEKIKDTLTVPIQSVCVIRAPPILDPNLYGSGAVKSA